MITIGSSPGLGWFGQSRADDMAFRNSNAKPPTRNTIWQAGAQKGESFQQYWYWFCFSASANALLGREMA
jgi:hypothetical protein